MIEKQFLNATLLYLEQQGSVMKVQQTVFYVSLK